MIQHNTTATPNDDRIKTNETKPLMSYSMISIMITSLLSTHRSNIGNAECKTNMEFGTKLFRHDIIEWIIKDYTQYMADKSCKLDYNAPVEII